MIPTFILHQDVTPRGASFESLNVNPKGYSADRTIYRSIERAIRWALENDEDVIYFVCEDSGLQELDTDLLQVILSDLAVEGIYSYYIQAESGSETTVNSYCSVLSDIGRTSSFLLIRPIFAFVLSLLQDKAEINKLSRKDFLHLIIPHAFCILQDHIVRESEHRIHIISPFYNAANYLSSCWESVHRQSYAQFTMYFIDDCSTDTGLDTIPDHPKLTKIRNAERKGALHNILYVLLNYEIGSDDVVCILDGDDELPHKYVLNILNQTYHDPGTKFSYGCYTELNGLKKFGAAYSREEFEHVRQSEWKVSPLRSFRYYVFEQLLRLDPDLKSFKKDDGEMIRMPYDMALFFPIMELVDFDQIGFMDTIMYSYRIHSNNDQRINRKEQYEGELVVRGKLPLSKQVG